MLATTHTPPKGEGPDPPQVRAHGDTGIYPCSLPKRFCRHYWALLLRGTWPPVVRDGHAVGLTLTAAVKYANSYSMRAFDLAQSWSSYNVAGCWSVVQFSYKVDCWLASAFAGCQAGSWHHEKQSVHSERYDTKSGVPVLNQDFGPVGG